MCLVDQVITHQQPCRPSDSCACLTQVTNKTLRENINPSDSTDDDEEQEEEEVTLHVGAGPSLAAQWEATKKEPPWLKGPVTSHGVVSCLSLRLRLPCKSALQDCPSNVADKLPAALPLMWFEDEVAFGHEDCWKVSDTAELSHTTPCFRTLTMGYE